MLATLFFDESAQSSPAAITQLPSPLSVGINVYGEGGWLVSSIPVSLLPGATFSITVQPSASVTPSASEVVILNVQSTDGGVSVPVQSLSFNSAAAQSYTLQAPLSAQQLTLQFTSFDSLFPAPGPAIIYVLAPVTLLAPDPFLPANFAPLVSYLYSNQTYSLIQLLPNSSQPVLTVSHGLAITGTVSNGTISPTHLHSVVLLDKISPYRHHK